MANNLSDDLELALLNHMFGGAVYTPNTGLKVALCTVASDDSYTEVAYSNYARATITFGAATGRRVTQDADVEFPTCGTTGAPADYYAIFNDGGDYLAWGTLAAQKIIVEGNTPTLVTNQVWVEFQTNGISDYLAHALLDMVFNGVAYSTPATYLALATADIADADVTAVIPNPPFDYVYQLVPSWVVSTPVAGTNQATNDTEIVYPPPTGAWGAITALAVVDVANNILFYDNVPGGDGQSPDVGDSVRLIPGAIIVGFE